MLSLNKLKELYMHAPLWVKNIYASIPYQIRSGKDYRKYCQFLEQNLDVEAYEILKLKETLYYAYENTIYYKNMFDKMGLSPSEIHSRDELEEIPMVTKEIIKDRFREFHALNYHKKNIFYVTTGGSSGVPMKFLQSDNIWKKELAYGTYYLKKFGYYPMEARVSFRGGDFDIKNNVFWKNNPIYNEVHFSPFHLSFDTIEHYAKKLDEVKAKMYLSYPSLLLLLIDLLEAKHINLSHHPKLILLISENMDSSDIRKIKNYFYNTKVISLYGHSERLIFGISSNNSLDKYSIDRRYGLFELVNEKNKIITENHYRGEIIGTGFDNWAMPLIRYKTGDYTEYTNKDKYQVSLIKGRWAQEYLSGYNGSRIFLTALNMHSDIFKNIQQYQFKELEVGKAELSVIPKREFSQEDAQIILEALNKRGGQNITFTLKCVDKIELTHRGKIKKIIKRPNNND